MKKITVLIFIVALLFLAVGCDANDKRLVVSVSKNALSSPYISMRFGGGTLTNFTFTNNSNKPAIVTEIRFQRMGISQDSVLKKVYLYKGNDKLIETDSIDGGQIHFKNDSGIFTVQTKSSVVIVVTIDIPRRTDSRSISVSLRGVVSSVPVSLGYPATSQELKIM